jgi:hypothetical protein
MRIFGLLWILPTVGFIVVAAALLAGWGWWQPALYAVALFSWVLTSLDWQVAKAGAIINVIIVIALWFGPRFGI